MEINDIVETAKWRMEKAHKELQNANKCFERQEYDDVATKSYYSVFYAMQALNILKIQDKLTHKGALIQFNKFYMNVETVKINKDASMYISQLRRLRERANYEDFYSVSYEDAVKALSRAKELVSNLNDILKEELLRMDNIVIHKVKLASKNINQKTKGFSR